jgi:hypothetical protein
MLTDAWVFIGVVALVATSAAVITDDDGIAIVGGVVGFVSWGVWSFGALDLTKVAGGGTETFTMTGVAYLGIMLALLPAYIALTGPVEIVSRARNGDIDKV